MNKLGENIDFFKEVGVNVDIDSDLRKYIWNKLSRGFLHEAEGGFAIEQIIDRDIWSINLLDY